MKTILLILALFFMQNTYAANVEKPLQCVAFSPYVNQFTPNYGEKPSSELIETLLDAVMKQTPFRCIMSYGVLNGLEAIFPAAKKRGIKVIAILWIDKDKRVNTDSIAHGIALARQYPETIVRLSCGSEVRTRNNYDFDDETERCLNALREAKVPQPIGVIDTWWEWCNREQPCHQTRFSSQVDWIGINIFPWWENRHADLFSCVEAEKAADFHLARWQELKKTNPQKEIIVTEFGWVFAPEGKAQMNLKTKKDCGGVASRKNQQLVLQSTFKKFAEKKISAVAFEAFSENWKPSEEGDFGRFWGLCDSVSPYTCHISLKLNP
ncbi:MAG: exo-beta-1,3-glucanase [Methylococcales bacterium]|nr:exo-beta-1,3-glucanase [Methylococcales bacterium]